MKLTLAYSTCPNDTFIFDALVNGKVDTEGITFVPVLGDVEELNRQAFKGGVDITKLSYHAYAYIADKYRILNSGSALGHNNGPLLVSRRIISPDEINSLRIAIPGKYTTANLLLGIAWPGAKNTKEHLFSDIEQLVLSNKADAGLLIHENRFTYHKRGLRKISDLGEYWDELTGSPIPLGAITIRRSLPDDITMAVDRSLRRSIEFAFNNPESSFDYVKKYAVEMEKSVMQKHIDLYVNNYTLDLGDNGKAAVRRLYKEAFSRSVIPEVRADIFIPSQE
jgi:1,4-dihydroxy-6-naphthoate synthase